MTKSKKKHNVSMTQLRQVLKQAAFNPKKPGPMKIVTDLDDPNYWMLKAVENLQTIQALPAREHKRMSALIIQSIQLLALAEARMSNG
jgi:hypothetical protein